MKAVLTGATGLIGSALVPFLEGRGWTVRRLARGTQWDPDRGCMDPAALRSCTALVHLAGENVARGRWTAEKKERIRKSRVEGTGLIARTIARLPKRPKVLVTASAIGFYGNRGEEVLDEESPAGRGFLAETCREWEEAARPAQEAGIRVVQCRIGMVLTPEGGALSRLLPLFRLGLGGRLGKGGQYISWITMEDLARVFARAMEDTMLSGPVNAVSPGPVTNREFTRLLAAVVRRPALLPVPAFALRLMMGRMADELLLSSARVRPGKLEAVRFQFRSKDLETALRGLLGKRGEPLDGDRLHEG